MGASAGTGFSSRHARAPSSVPSHVYRPTYQMQGLSFTPQARSYMPYGSQLPTFNRPSPMMPMQPTSYRIPTAPTAVQRPAADPNLLAISQALAPRQTLYDSEGSSYMAPRYMEQSQRDAILQNPETYLNYARYIQAGNDPSGYRASMPRPQIMSQTQRDALTKSQSAKLSSMLPPAASSDSGGD